MTPLRLGLGALALLVVGLLAWGLEHDAWDRAHPISLAGSAPCPTLTRLKTERGSYCDARSNVGDGAIMVAGHQPCACDGAKRSPACVVRGPAIALYDTSTGIGAHLQVPKGVTAFLRADGEDVGCWMVPNARIDSANPRRLLYRVRFPGS